MIAERVGAMTPQKRIESILFKEIVKRFDPWRESVESKLEDFNEETQSWRGQSEYVCDIIPEEVWVWGHRFLEDNAKEQPPALTRGTAKNNNL